MKIIKLWAMEQGIEYDYMQRMKDFFQVFDQSEFKGEQDILKGLLATSDIIHEVSDHVSNTQLFTGAAETYKEFISDIEKESHDHKKRLILSYDHFLDRICMAPTSIHLRGVVVLCVPAISYFMRKYQEQCIAETE